MQCIGLSRGCSLVLLHVHSRQAWQRPRPCVVRLVLHNASQKGLAATRASKCEARMAVKTVGSEQAALPGSQISHTCDGRHRNNPRDVIGKGEQCNVVAHTGAFSMQRNTSVAKQGERCVCQCDHGQEAC
jgi:hypothetical protein